MIIVGARGFATELFDVVSEKTTDIAFYDDVNSDIKGYIYNKFPILKSEGEVLKFFESNKSNEYTIGLGNPFLRFKVYEKFNSLGGKITSIISDCARIGNYSVCIGEGTNILPNAVFSSNTSIGKCGLVYYNVVVTHDCKIGDFVELSPNAIILGRCTIGDYTHIGANATILPDICMK